MRTAAWRGSQSTLAADGGAADGGAADGGDGGSGATATGGAAAPAGSPALLLPRTGAVALSLRLRCRHAHSGDGDDDGGGGGVAVQRLVLGNVHIHWDYRRPDVQALQAAEATREAYALAAGARVRGEPAARIPLILCGDYNSKPQGAVHRLLRDGRLSGGRRAELRCAVARAPSALAV
eukprot:SAG11_NODE_2260_length_3610_cov_3.120478_1_plen_179_part_00